MIPEEVHTQIRAKYPKQALKEVYIDPDALTPEEAEDVPFVVIRRIPADGWEKIEEVARKNQEKKKGEKSVNIDREICKLAVVYVHGAEDLDGLLNEFAHFETRIAEAVYRFSGLGDPLVRTLPKGV
jgi:hypothetical protein